MKSDRKRCAIGILYRDGCLIRETKQGTRLFGRNAMRRWNVEQVGMARWLRWRIITKVPGGDESCAAASRLVRALGIGYSVSLVGHDGVAR